MLSKETLIKIKKMMAEYSDLNEQFVNILLVASKGRDAYLIETSGFKEEYGIEGGLEILHQFMEILNEEGYQFFIKETDIAVEGYPRFFVTDHSITLPRNDYEIGKLLGMYCADHYDYGDYTQDRTAVNIFAIFKELDQRIDLYAEVCIRSKLNREGLEKSSYDKVEKWKNSLKSLGLDIPIFLEISEVISYPTLERKIEENDLRFLKNNWDAYFNYFANEIDLDGIIPFVADIPDRGIDKKTLKFVKYLIKKVKEGKKMKLPKLIEKYEKIIYPTSSSSKMRD